MAVGEEEYGIKVHHGKCDSCEKRNIQIVNYGYFNQTDEDRKNFRLCPKCIGRGLLALENPLVFKPVEEDAEVSPSE